jgi:hypothetical protein
MTEKVEQPNFTTFTILAFMVIPWVIGIAVSEGWSLFFSIVFAPYAWVVTAKYFIGV